MRIRLGELRKIVQKEMGSFQEGRRRRRRSIEPGPEEFNVDDLHVTVDEGNTGLVGTFQGTVDGVGVEGSLYYGMDMEDANVLSVRCTPDDMSERVSEVIDTSPEFGQWAEWAMENTPKY